LSRHSFLLLTCVGFSCVPVTAWAQSTETASTNATESHALEVLAEVGFAIPGSWYTTPNNQSLGSNVSGSLLGYLGRGWSLGAAVEWTRLHWTPHAGPGAHVDTWIIGPEVRYTFNPSGRILPHAYLGIGLGGVSQSRPSLGGEYAGGPAARAGAGVDLRINRFLRLGISAGITVMPPSYADHGVPQGGELQDPQSPEAPGNVWSLRLGGRGEFL